MHPSCQKRPCHSKMKASTQPLLCQPTFSCGSIPVWISFIVCAGKGFIYSRKLIYWSMILLLWNNGTLLAQPSSQGVAFDRIGENQGLTSSNLYRIYQDETGFLWVCTINGLYQYDGLKFRHFRSDPVQPEGFSEDFIKQYIEDREGNGLAITDNGQLYILIPEETSFKRLYLTSSLTKAESIQVRQMALDANGRLLVIVSGQGLLQLDMTNGNLTIPTGLEEIAPGVKIMTSDPETGDLWLIAGSKLYVFPANQTTGGQTPLSTGTEIGMTRINDLMVDRSGKVWLGGYDDRVICYDPNNQTTRNYPYQHLDQSIFSGAPNRVNTLSEDLNGTIWIGTNYTGIIRLDPVSGKMTELSYDRDDLESLSSNTVTDIFCDRTGILWVTTWGKGLNKYVPGKDQFGHIRSVTQHSYTLSDPVVTAFYEQPDGDLWIGTEGGMNLMNGRSGRIERFPFPKGLFQGRDNMIYAIQPVSPSDRQLWLGTTLGLMRFDPLKKSFSLWHSPDAEGRSLEQNIIYYLITDTGGKLWAVSYSPYKLFQYHPEQDKFTAVDIVSKVVVSGDNPVVMADLQHNVWIGTNNGRFYRYSVDDGNLQVFQLPPGDTSGLQTGNIGHFYTDGKKRLWLGTSSGLYRIRFDATGKIIGISRFTEKDGLAGPQVLGILEDVRGFLWLSTNNGLSRLDPETLIFQNFRHSDGLQANEFGFGVCARGTYSGKLFFGGINGFNHFDPNLITLDTFAPPVVLTGVQVLQGDQAIQVAGWSRSSQVDQKKLILNYNDKVITIGFAALHYADPSRNQIAYRMEGFDPDWRMANNQHQATYTNLDPGNYTFRVKACNKDGIWNEIGTSLQLTILPPWWATWWAWLIYLLVFTGVVISVFRYQSLRNQERSEAIRIREMDQVKTRLYTNITHEFRTPLTVISGMAGMIKEPDEARDMIQRNADSLLLLINQILDLAKLESGQMPLDLACFDIIPYVQYVSESFQAFAASKQITLVTYPECEKLVMDMDEQKLYSILSNLLSNAIKFTSGGGKIIIHLREEANQLVLKVKDTGQGIPREHLPFVFDRFYQVDASSTRKGEGTGIGLTLTKELVEFMHGQISVKSQVGEGTEFTVNIPISTLAQRSTPQMHVHPFPAIGSPDNIPIHSPSADDNRELPRLLLIEDNQDVAVYIQLCLEGLFQVDIATNGVDGIEQAVQTIPDVLISDVMMPEKDGFEVCQAIKNDERTSHIPVILLTAKADIDSRLTGLSAGADAYLSKPFVKEELLIRLQKLIELRQTLQQRFSSIHHPESIDSDSALDNTLDGQFLFKVRQLVLDYLGDESFGNAQLASKIHLSESQLFRKLKALTGISTALYIRQIRLHQARQLLLNSDKTVAEIAYEVGFSDPAYFSRTFSQEFGISPNAMRK